MAFKPQLNYDMFRKRPLSRKGGVTGACCLCVYLFHLSMWCPSGKYLTFWASVSHQKFWGLKFVMTVSVNLVFCNFMSGCWGWNSMIERSPSMYEAVGSIPSTTHMYTCTHARTRTHTNVCKFVITSIAYAFQIFTSRRSQPVDHRPLGKQRWARS